MSLQSCVLVLSAVLILCCTAEAAVLPTESPSMGVRVEAGNYVVRGRSVRVALAAVLPVAERDKISVKAEEHVLSEDNPQAWAGGTSLAKTLGPVDVGTRLPFAILPESVRVHSEPSGGTLYQEGKDYLLDHIWGGISRANGGAIAKGAKVYVDYEVYLLRVDTVQVSSSGAASIKRGKPAPVCPVIPEPDEGRASLANIYISYHTAAIDTGCIYRLPEKDMSWRDFVKSSGRKNLSKTLGLLRSGKPVTVVCWGDSVTEGASPSSHDKCYVESFRSRLKAAYPHSEITLINAGIGGSNTDSRRDGYEKEVLSHNPDLITVEFVNDVGMGAEKIKSNWAEFIARARAKNPDVEFVLITPHNVMPEWMGKFSSSVDAMRKAAADNKVALADANNIWTNLREVGIPYYTLLANGINHPDDLGHEFFVACLMDVLKPGR